MPRLAAHRAADLGRHARPLAGGEAGIALPMALLTLVIVSSLAMAFAAVARHEPLIADNHLTAAQARVAAESGLERALWALTHPTASGSLAEPGGLPDSAPPAVVPAPYDGSGFVRIGIRGGFFLTITGEAPHLRTARSIGWSPNPPAPGRRTGSTRTIVARLARLPDLARGLGCALCARPPLSVGSTVSVDARGDGSSGCGRPVALAGSADVLVDPAARLLGSDAPVDGATVNVEGRDWKAQQPLAFLGDDDLDTLRALAGASGTYLRPLADTPVDLADLPDGLVFVDSPQGTNAVTAGNHAQVRLGRGFARGHPFRGWIVVNGDVTFDGAPGDVLGVVYAANTFHTLATTGVRVTGMLIAAGALGAEALTLAGVDVTFDCAAARGAGLLPTGWFVRPGSYCDAPGC